MGGGVVVGVVGGVGSGVIGGESSGEESGAGTAGLVGAVAVGVSLKLRREITFNDFALFRGCRT